MASSGASSDSNTVHASLPSVTETTSYPQEASVASSTARQTGSSSATSIFTWTLPANRPFVYARLLEIPIQGGFEASANPKRQIRSGLDNPYARFVATAQSSGTKPQTAQTDGRSHAYTTRVRGRRIRRAVDGPRRGRGPETSGWGAG